tara:strand:+ start:194 stop:1120 length:927 start_codon:yes stop_codon:yes gene_type:complete
MTLISVVSPVFEADDCLHELYQRLVANLSVITKDYEIILVEDGGNDNSWNIIKSLAENDSKVKGIKLSRNFGVHHAITAGLDISSGEWIIVIECDLQSPPEKIKDLYFKALEGYDVVIAKFIKRADNIFRRISSRIFWRSMSYLSGMKLNPQHGVYRIMSRQTVNNFKLFSEQERHFKAIIEWIGVNYSTIEMDRDERFSGKSAFTFSKLVNATFSYIVGYSSKPLMIFTGIGILSSISAFLVSIIVLISRLLYGTDVTGWSSLMLSIYFIGGIIITNLGILGYYVGKNYDETKKRPIYFIGDKTYDS